MKPTPQQKKVIDWFEKGDGHLVVQARAGSGKTTVILKAAQVAPEGMILITAFNRRIIDETKAKVQAIDWGHRSVYPVTLNSIGSRFCVKNGSRLVEDKLRKIVLPKIMSGDDLKYKAGAVRDLVDKAKGMIPFAMKPSDFFPIIDEFKIKVSTWNDPTERTKLAGYALQAMQLSAEMSEIHDFTDQIYLPLVKSWVTPEFELVVVDEAQDMNYAMNELAMRASSGRVCVVGDDRQAIYRFRGADITALSRMGDLLKAKRLPLTHTFRCGKVIVDLAREIVPDFEAGPSNPPGEILNLDLAGLLDRVRPRDAILSRSNAPLMGLCMRFIKKGMKAKIAGRDEMGKLTRFIDAFSARSVENLLELVAAWKVKELDKARKRDNEKLQQEILDKAEVVEYLAADADAMADIFKRIDKLSMTTEEDSGKAPYDGIVLSSVHKAKGLEWDRVFLLESTFFRSKKATAAVLQEQDNIRYVAITRAKTHLFLVEGKV